MTEDIKVQPAGGADTAKLVVATLLVILGVAVLLFGGSKIPEVAKGLGEGIRNFKSAMKGDAPKEIEKA